MYCRNCGNEIADGSKFCNHCGSPVTAEPPVQEKALYFPLTFSGKPPLSAQENSRTWTS